MTDAEKLMGNYRESSQKFDYFIVGLSVALLAYSIQSFDSLHYDKYTFLAPLAWLFLLLSILAGIVRLEYSISLLGIGSKKLEAYREYNEISNPSILYRDAETKQHLSQEEMQPLIQERKEIIAIIEKHEKRYAKIANISYKFHQWLLVIGLFFLGLFKTLNF